MSDSVALRSLPSVGGTECWLISLPLVETDLADRMLPPMELGRATRFRFEKDRHQFLASRIILRTILSRHLAVPPTDVDIRMGCEGKPFVNGYPLHFNLSHSGHWALFALHRSCPIGVDIEMGCPLPELTDLVLNCFNASEQAEIEQTYRTDQLAAFYRCWTRKEACLKALGSGFLIEPTAFSAGTSSQPSITSVPTDAGKISNMTVHSLALPHDIRTSEHVCEPAAAIAVLHTDSHHLAI